MRGASITLPAPIGGLNLRDQITELKPYEARHLENWLPEAGKLTIRPGYELYANATGAAIRTLVEWSGASSTKFLSASDAHIQTVTGGTVATLSSGFTNTRFQTAQMSGRIFFVNGVNPPRDYDGTTLTATAWTGSGLTISNLVNVAHVRERLWFCEENSADVWYGGIASVTGSLTKFQLSQIASGGECMAIGTQSADGGSGMDDFTVFVMSTGQIIIYQGDPATTFSKVGVYDTGAPPIGRRCLFKMGGELVVITRLGLLPVSAAVASSNALNISALDPWGKIAPLIAEYAKNYGSNAGWQGVVLSGVVYISIPTTEDVSSVQVVLNTRTGAWTTYTGWNAVCLGTFNGELYFGGPTLGFVWKATGNTDNGSSIPAKARQAFVVPKKGGSSFTYTAVRPRISSQGFIAGSVGVDTDFASTAFPSDSVQLVKTGNTTPWGSAWGSGWGAHPESTNVWISTRGDGRSVGVKMSTLSNAFNVEWSASDVLMIAASIK